MPIDLRWYETFFGGIVLDFWGQVVPPAMTEAEAEFLMTELRLAPGRRVLDVPCGLGRHARALAARGVAVTAADLSEEALARARSEADAAGLSIEWLRRDMRDLSGLAGFDAVFSLGNSFGYLPPAETRDYLRGVAAALVPGGRFVMDTGYCAESLLPHFEEHQETEVAGYVFREENRYHVREGCVETIYTFERNGETVTRAGFQWVHTVREILAMLEAAGLRTEALYGSPAREPYRFGNPVLLLSARAPE